MASYIAMFFSLVSIILMIIILIRFKKLFSTDAIIEKTKSQMNRVIMDVNNNANRDLELINESTRRLRNLLNEADKKMENFKEATQLLRDMIAEAESAGSKVPKQVIYMEKSREEKSKNPSSTTLNKKANPYIDPNSAYSIKNPESTASQRSLFDDDEPAPSIVKDETLVTADGAAYKEVPLIITKVYDDKTNNVPSASPKSLKEKVEKLFNQGMKIEDIAAELSCPISEVQFIIDMSV